MKKIWQWLLVEEHRKALSFIGTAIAVLVGAGWTYFTYFDVTDRPIESRQRADTIPREIPEPVQLRPEKPESVAAKESPAIATAEKSGTGKTTAFSGVYVGVSTEGMLKQPIKITFEQKGNISKGTYSMSGMLGTMNGTISGNTYKYSWQLGGFSGKGISLIRGNTIEGTWGYANSDSNGGTLTAQLQ